MRMLGELITAPQLLTEDMEDATGFQSLRKAWQKQRSSADIVSFAIGDELQGVAQDATDVMQIRHWRTEVQSLPAASRVYQAHGSQHLAWLPARLALLAGPIACREYMEPADVQNAVDAVALQLH